MNLFDPPPFVAGSPTSKEAAASIAEAADTIRLRIYWHLFNLKDVGSTCDEAELKLSLTHQTCSAAIRGLVKAGWLCDSGRTRKTRSGRNAVVWINSKTEKS